MTKEVAEKIAKGITDKIECNTVDIDDWAEFWGFTREEYEEFLDMAIKALERQEKTLSYIDRLLNQGTGKKKSLEFLKKYILEGEKNDNIPNDHGNSISCHTDNQDNAEPHIAVSSAQGV